MTETALQAYVDPGPGGSPHPIDVLVGLSVRRVRKQQGMSQDTLARQIGLTFQQVQKYERGTNRISCSMLWQIGKALGVPPSSLLPESEAPESSGIAAHLARYSKLEQLAADYVRLDPRAQRAVRRLVRDLSSSSVDED